ncbi:MAG: HNH endonuclease, partial [Phycisphaeraceae bacterium]
MRDRAKQRCEYCMLPEWASPIPFHIKHIRARQHGGGDQLDNLALACDRCNLHKGPNLTSIDPETGEITPLFHPREQSWDEHFDFDGPLIIGLTAIGRTTLTLLQMNAPRRRQLREAIGDFR